jgi:hypothetical protein
MYEIPHSPFIFIFGFLLPPQDKTSHACVCAREREARRPSASAFLMEISSLISSLLKFII